MDNNEMAGCTHDWLENRAWTDERGINHIERKCLKCKELTEVVSAADIHEWQPVNRTAVSAAAVKSVDSGKGDTGTSSNA